MHIATHGIVASSVGGSTPAFTNTLSTTFDGTDDYVNIGDSNSLSFGNGTTDTPFSISSWWYMTNASNFRGFQKFNSLTNCEYRLNGTANSLRFAICDANFYNRKEIVFANLSTYENQWINVIATYNANGLNSGMKLYINGTQVSTTDNNQGTYVAMHNTTSDVTISKLLTNYSNGKVDETAVFNSELSASDASAIGSTTPTDLTSYSPLSWWRMGDGDTYPTITDNAGSNDGLMKNMSAANFVADVP